LGLIDCDVHPYITGVKDVFPYLPKAWQQYFSKPEIRIAGRPADRYPHPGHVLRDDAIPPGGGMPASDPAYTVKDHLDRYDIEAAVLLPLQAAAVCTWTDPVASDVFTRACNDYFLEKWCALDSRYRLTITVSPHDPALSAKEIRRLGERKEIIGVNLPLLGTLMGNRHYYPIYDAAVEFGLPVFVHPTGAEGAYTGLPPLAGGIPRTYGERHTLLPQIAMSNLASVIFEGVFERYPTMTVFFVELGFSWALTLGWRMDREWKNFRFDTPWLKKSPMEYVQSNVRFTSQPMDEPPKREQLWRVMEMMGADHVVCFASDYPHYDADNPQSALAALPDGLRQRIGWETAKETLAARL
jgi:predicted TIM-barrel fold metal-dependent hydrolase